MDSSSQDDVAQQITACIRYFGEFQFRRMQELGLGPQDGVLAASEYHDGVEKLSCVFGFAPSSFLIPLFVGVPPLGDLDAVLSAILRLSAFPSPALDTHCMLRLEQSGFFRSEGLAAVLLLPAATLGYLAGLPDPWQNGDGVMRRFTLPVFVDEREYRIGKHDIGALMDDLERSGRDLMSIRRRFVDS